VTDSNPDYGARYRLAFLTELYSPNVGGQEVFFQELAETLVRRGHSVDVHCIGHTPGLAAREMVNGVQVFRHANGGRYLSPRVAALRRNWTDILKYSAQVRKLASAQQYDFYLMNEWPVLHIPALPRKARTHGAIHWCEVRDGGPMAVAQRLFPRLVGANFAVSNAVATTVSAQSGRQFGVLPSGIELPRYHAAEPADRSGILCVGRVAAHKNLPLLIDAFALAAGQGLTGNLVIAGNGPARSDVEAYARLSPVADRIKVLGSVTEAEKIDLLAQSSVLGMPSKREGFPRVVAEAMASGLPVVTADFPENGAAEVVAQYGVGIVCGTTPSAFAAALLAAEEQWDEFSRAGLIGAKSLDWSGIAETLETRIREVTGK
jgi:glycosyltransferase involved in cell wall biosynthesis